MSITFCNTYANKLLICLDSSVEGRLRIKKLKDRLYREKKEARKEWSIQHAVSASCTAEELATTKVVETRSPRPIIWSHFVMVLYGIGLWARV